MRKLENGALIAVVHDCERERTDAVAGGCCERLQEVHVF